MDFIALAQACAPLVEYQTLAAVVKTESDFKPFVIGVNGDIKLSHQPETKEEAVKTANWLISKGINIDMGLGQINSSNLEMVGLTVSDIFDPCNNLQATAKILSSNYAQAKRNEPDDQTALRATISAYNTGSFAKGFSNGYVQRVINNVDVVLQDVGGQSEKIQDLNEDRPLKLNSFQGVFAGAERTWNVFESCAPSGVLVMETYDNIMVY